MDGTLLPMIDNIDVVTEAAELDVMCALSNTYTKEIKLYQEGKFLDDVNAPIKGKDGESTIKKILMFIPRLIAKIIRMITRLIQQIKRRKMRNDIRKDLERFYETYRRNLKHYDDVENDKKIMSDILNSMGIELDKYYDAPLGYQYMFRITQSTGDTENYNREDRGRIDDGYRLAIFCKGDFPSRNLLTMAYSSKLIHIKNFCAGNNDSNTADQLVGIIDEIIKKDESSLSGNTLDVWQKILFVLTTTFNQFLEVIEKVGMQHLLPWYGTDKFFRLFGHFNASNNAMDPLFEGHNGGTSFLLKYSYLDEDGRMYQKIVDQLDIAKKYVATISTDEFRKKYENYFKKYEADAVTGNYEYIISRMNGSLLKLSNHITKLAEAQTKLQNTIEAIHERLKEKVLKDIKRDILNA